MYTEKSLFTLRDQRDEEPDKKSMYRFLMATCVLALFVVTIHHFAFFGPEIRPLEGTSQTQD